METGSLGTGFTTSKLQALGRCPGRVPRRFPRLTEPSAIPGQLQGVEEAPVCRQIPGKDSEPFWVPKLMGASRSAIPGFLVEKCWAYFCDGHPATAWPSYLTSVPRASFVRL